MGKSVHAVRAGTEGGKESAKKLHLERDGFGRSLHALKTLGKVHEERDEFGRSVQGVKSAKKVNSQIWESTVDGYTSTAAGVAQHNKFRGWDPNARKRVN